MTDLERIPKPQPGFDLAEMDGESLLYRHESMTMVYLNDAAAAVWKLCDGERTVGEIVDVLAEAFPDVASEIGTDVPKMIERFVDEKVLELG